MEIMLMSASAITAIVLSVIGVIKLPFKKFKESHGNWYKGVFTLLSIAISIGLCVIDELFVLKGELMSMDFVVLICVVIAGVFCGYGGIYEGLGLKELVKKIIENIKVVRATAKDKKVVEYLNKVEDVERAIAILEERRNGNNTEETEV